MIKNQWVYKLLKYISTILKYKLVIFKQFM